MTTPFPWESVFVVFRPGSRNAGRKTQSSAKSSLPGSFHVARISKFDRFLVCVLSFLILVVEQRAPFASDFYSTVRASLDRAGVDDSNLSFFICLPVPPSHSKSRLFDPLLRVLRASGKANSDSSTAGMRFARHGWELRWISFRIDSFCSAFPPSFLVTISPAVDIVTAGGAPGYTCFSRKILFTR